MWLGGVSERRVSFTCSIAKCVVLNVKSCLLAQIEIHNQDSASPPTILELAPRGPPQSLSAPQSPLDPKQPSYPTRVCDEHTARRGFAAPADHTTAECFTTAADGADGGAGPRGEDGGLSASRFQGCTAGRSVDSGLSGAMTCCHERGQPHVHVAALFNAVAQYSPRPTSRVSDCDGTRWSLS